MRVLSTPELNEISGGNLSNTLITLVGDICQSEACNKIGKLSMMIGGGLGAVGGFGLIMDPFCQDGIGLGIAIVSATIGGAIGAYGGGMAGLPIAFAAEGIARVSNYIGG